jgi:putative ABC transport system substrate-binding protein
MRRRDFIRATAAVTTTWPLAARAQQPAMPVIGYLSGATFEMMRDYVAAFHRTLADQGFTEGRNIGIE